MKRFVEGWQVLIYVLWTFLKRAFEIIEFFLEVGRGKRLKGRPIDCFNKPELRARPDPYIYSQFWFYIRPIPCGALRLVLQREQAVTTRVLVCRSSGARIPSRRRRRAVGPPLVRRYGVPSRIRSFGSISAFRAAEVLDGDL
jgi:hypothetical protein